MEPLHGSWSELQDDCGVSECVWERGGRREREGGRGREGERKVKSLRQHIILNFTVSLLALGLDSDAIEHAKCEQYTHYQSQLSSQRLCKHTFTCTTTVCVRNKCSE